jgi:hypothetical protein
MLKFRSSYKVLIRKSEGIGHLPDLWEDNIKMCLNKREFKSMECIQLIYLKET